MRTVVIYVGGDGPDVYPASDDEILGVIAADSGLHLADAHGMNVDLIVGDMDSVDDHLLDKYEKLGSIVSRFPHEKDETDFELAILAAQNYGAEKLVVIGGGGGRLDHLLANIGVLSGPLTENHNAQMYLRDAEIKICRPGNSVSWSGKIGDEVSLIPINNDASGVSTEGLRWELNSETLHAYTSRGISNFQSNTLFKVQCSSGAIAVIKAT